MNSESSEPNARPVRSLVAGIAVLGAVLLLVSVCVCPWVYQLHGATGVYASLIAAGVCWTSGSLALATTMLMAGGPQAVTGLFLAMAIRLGLPLATGVAVTIAGGRLAEAGLFGLIVVHYLVALLVETYLAVRFIGNHSPRVPAL